MTERVVLHVGPPKTGTTLLQHTLSHNSELLQRAGVVYPAPAALAPRWRHDFAMVAAHPKPETLGWVHRNGGIAGALKVADRLGDSVRRIVDESRAHTVVLSAESFGSANFTDAADATRVRAVAAFAGQLAPSVQALAYVRPHVAHSTSIIQHLVRHGIRRLADAYENPPVFSYRSLAELYRRVGIDMSLRSYTRDSDPGFDIVNDFGLHLIGEPLDLRVERSKSNHSGSLEAVLLSDALSAAFPQPQVHQGEKNLERDPFAIPHAITGSKFRLPEAVQERIREMAAPDVEYLKQEWDIELAEAPLSEPSESLEPWGPDSLESLARFLNHRARQVRRLKRRVATLEGESEQL